VCIAVHLSLTTFFAPKAEGGFPKTVIVTTLDLLFFHRCLF